jgi:acetyl-CoA synthetase
MSYQWNPTADYIEHANVTRLARAHGLARIGGLRTHSVADTAWFRDTVLTGRGRCRGILPLRLMETN